MHNTYSQPRLYQLVIFNTKSIISKYSLETFEKSTQSIFLKGVEVEFDIGLASWLDGKKNSVLGWVHI